mmetsp:Transcript_32292/g.48178  ORF Transcript_32292/g.48178 Transcript_32292/m.48178 type:complete len:116 (-) Transcript_32292:111-458(-)
MQRLENVRELTVHNKTINNSLIRIVALLEVLQNVECCLPDKHGSSYHSYPSGCNNSDEYPTWESCVNDWKNCCLAGTGGVLGKQGQRPLYSGVDFADGASCCQLCNGGNWGPQLC